MAGLWLLVPWYVPHILMVLSISLAARTLPGAFRLWHPPENRGQWLALATRAGATVIGVATLWVAVHGRSPPSETPVDLVFPLRSGHYYIANGDAGEFHILLAHMRDGSVAVHPGDYVTTDSKLGNVGHSGNSDEPHLRVHAQRPGHIWDVFTGDPLPVTFNGRYLIRNDRLTVFEAVEEIDD